MPNPSERTSIRERFLKVDAANVADVLDDMKLPYQGLASNIQGITSSRVAGWAYTIAGRMMPYEGSGDPKKMEACNGIGADEISVWSGEGQGICYFGELIALGMRERGSVGAIVDGGLRDTRALQDHGFPVFGTYRTAVQSIGRWRVTSYQEPIYLPGAASALVIVRPGDFLLGDEDGAIVIPAEVVDSVLDTAEAITNTEVEVRRALSGGMTLVDALNQFGHI